MRKMETCNIREMRVHPDSVHVEGEETTGLMRAGKTWTRGEGSRGLRD